MPLGAVRYSGMSEQGDNYLVDEDPLIPLEDDEILISETIEELRRRLLGDQNDGEV